MKILWLVNVPMPKGAQALGIKSVNAGGWLVGQLEALVDCGENICVLHATPYVKEIRSVVVENVKYIFAPIKNASLQQLFAKILKEEKPDIVHIFGTEYAHSLAMVNVCDLNKCVVSIQGVMAECAVHYSDGLPQKYNKISLAKALMKKLYYADCIALEKQEFEKRAELEKQALKKVRHVIGRTSWDKVYVKKINSDIKYYHVNENLREEFYCADKWEYKKCEKHSIFVSQGFYPIKGLHMLLKAMPELVKKYPDIHLYIGGIKPYTLNNKLLDVAVDYFFEYQSYIKRLIKDAALKKNITYTGSLNAAEMKQRYLISNAFVSPSTIENSPNSVGEAMLLGVPIAASNVGGTSSMLTDGQDGLLYDFYDNKQLITCIEKIFDDTDTAEKMSAMAKKHAEQTHNRKENTKALLKTYNAVLGKINN